MLGPYYKDSGNGNKQPINLQSFPNLEDVKLALTSIISRTNNP